MISTLFSWFKPSTPMQFDHKVNADISVVPLGTDQGASISKYTRSAGEILARSGLSEVKTHGFGTNVSGEWSKVKNAIDRIAQNQLEDLNVPRVSINLKLSFRKDKNQSIYQRLAKA